MEKKKIIQIIKPIDQRITLLQQTNLTLRSIADSLFKSWFIDFDPVRAKMDGTEPECVPAETAEIFPSGLEQTKLGKVPNGWIGGSFGDLVSQCIERVRNRKVVILSAVANGKLQPSDIYFNKRVYSQETDKYLAVEQWDFAYNPSRINIGSIGMHLAPVLGGVSPVYVVFRPIPSYKWYIEFLLRKASTRAWINTLASGSVRQSLSYSHFASIPCVIPPQEVVDGFNKIWEPLFISIKSRDEEIQTLISIRDAILPLLFSGKLQVPDIVEFPA